MKRNDENKFSPKNYTPSAALPAERAGRTWIGRLIVSSAVPVSRSHRRGPPQNWVGFSEMWVSGVWTNFGGP